MDGLYLNALLHKSKLDNELISLNENFTLQIQVRIYVDIVIDFKSQTVKYVLKKIQIYDCQFTNYISMSLIYQLHVIICTSTCETFNSK